METVEVHPPAVNSVEMTGVAVDQENEAVGYAPAHALGPRSRRLGIHRAVDGAGSPPLHALTGASG